MAVKLGRLVQMTLDQQVLHGIIAFGRFLMLAGGKVSNHCYSFVRIYHWLILFINGGCSIGRNVCFLTMYYCRPWPDVVMITLAFYAISTNLLLRILLIHRNILLKNCSGESLSGRIVWQRIVFTARCTLVQSAVLRSHVVCLSVCLSVTLVNCDHIG